MVVVAILTITLGMFSSLMVTTAKLGPMNRETARAVLAASNVVEAMRNVPFDEVWARYNDDPADDPDGAGTAPGSGFAVAGLRARPGDADGLVGRIVLPGTAEHGLRENLDLPTLSLPRDLNGDGEVDELDHADDYVLLPVLVRIEWTGASGPRAFTMVTMLADV